MMLRGLLIAGSLCGVLAATPAPHAWAIDPGEAIEAVGPGTVNWTVGIVTATGVGAPPPNAVSAAQARGMAERAAFSVAVRNLLEAVKGIRVDSVSLVENMLVTSDVVRSQVNGVVKGARVIKTEHQPDGGVEVTVAISLNGGLVDAVLPKQFGPPVSVTGPSSPVRPPPAMAPVPAPAPPALEPPPPAATPAPLPLPAPQAAPPDAHTGLIVDARGLGLKPALAPRLLDEQGQELYAGQVLSRDQAVQAGVVGYAKDMVAGSRQPRVTDNPLVVKGSKVSGPKHTDIVLGADEVTMIQKTEPAARYLRQARVVVVYD